MDKISPIKERILYFIENKNIKKSDFCKITNISYANLKGKSLKSEIGGSQIAEILTNYPELSPDWLILGIGNMKRGKITDEITDNNDCDIYKAQQKVIESLKSTISSQDNLINILSDMLRM